MQESQAAARPLRGAGFERMGLLPAPQGVAAGFNDWVPPWAPWAALGMFVALFAFINFWRPSEIIWDQGFILKTLTWNSFPDLDSGLLSYELVGGINRVFSPSEAHVNSLIKTLAMLMYAAGAVTLARAVLKTSTALLLFVLMLFMSRYPILWLSTELFAGAFLSMAVASLLLRWPAWISGALLACAGLTKPDVMLPAVALMGYCLLVTVRDQRLGLVAGFGAVFVVIVGPSLVRYRGPYFVNRSFVSFGQHYAALFDPHQLHPLPNPWIHWKEYMDASFPGSHSVAAAIRQHPLRYLDFVLLSAFTGLRFIMKAFHVMLLSSAARISEGFRRRLTPQLFEQYLLVSLIGVIPWLLISFPHVRYYTRYYPLVILVSFRWLEWSSRPRLARTLIYAALALQAVIFFHNLGQVHMYYRLWRPD